MLCKNDNERLIYVRLYHKYGEVTYTSGSGYACAEIEPNAIYVRSSEHYAVRRVKSSNAFMDDFQATYN